MTATIEIVRYSQADTDWHIGYVDGQPAVGDDAGNWYIVAEGSAVHNRYGETVWFVEDGQWGAVFVRNWDGDIAGSNDITCGGPDYTAPTW